jgi:hypothetical protein
LGRLVLPRSFMGRNGSQASLADAWDKDSDAGSLVAAEELLLQRGGYQSSLSML